MLKFLKVIVVIVALVLGYGYWHATTHGWVNISLYDSSNKDDYGRLYQTEITLRDVNGAFLAEGKSDDTYGIIRLSHPEVGDCASEEKATIYDKEARSAWQTCFARHATWVMKWAPDIHSMDVSFGDCMLREVPVRVSVYRDWWLWWVPLPHVGGDPYTGFSISLRVDGLNCRAET